MTSPLLSVESLRVSFGVPGRQTEVLHGVSFNVAAGEKVALVGESGSGKSVSAMSVLRLHDPVHTSYNGRIQFDGHDLLDVPPRVLRGIRGGEVGMIFQEPMSALNPVFPVGRQISETLTVHRGMDRGPARQRAIELLGMTGIDRPEERVDAFPHMLSGGQRQRAMIAMALACDPKILIADEPTTALDVTIQAQILALLDRLQRERNLAIVLISHDMSIVRRFAERAYVMRDGLVVEQGRTERLFREPEDAYTRLLIESRPERLIGDAPIVCSHSAEDPLARLEDVRCHFPIRTGFLRRPRDAIRAVDGVSLDIRHGETVGIVGESGSGKSTLGRCLLMLERPEGRIEFDGRSLIGLRGNDLRRLRRDAQIVFQDPYGSLSPRMTVEEIVGEGLRVHHKELDREARRERIRQALDEVGLDAAMMWRYPHEFSGGQRQRIAIARALVLEPKLLVLDEPTSALDASVQKQVLGLLHELQQKRGMSYLFISHDLTVVRAVAHRVAVMHEGKIVESGPAEQLFDSPQHEYTKRLLGAALKYEAVAEDADTA